MPTARDEHAASDSQAFWSDFVLPRLALTKGISPRDKSDAVRIARQVLNDELSAMHLAMCSIRTRLNSLCPISALPAELLVHIFELYASTKPAGSCVDSGGHLGWIEVTHVCRLWRDTALQSPGLWSDVCFKLGSQWTKVMLARAKSVPISVHWDETKGTQESLNFISEHLHHTRKLSLVGWPAILKPIMDTLPSPPGTLEIVELGADADAMEVEGGNSELPRSLFGHRLPSLRRLVLRAFWVPWSAPILCGLTHLEILLFNPCSQVTNPYLSFSHEELFTSLKNMPGLETLILGHCLPFGPWKIEACDILQLPALKVLQLQGPSTTCLGITKRLQIPSPCQVHLRCTDYADIFELLPFLAAQANGPNLPAWYTFRIMVWSRPVIDNTNFHFKIELWRRSDAFEDNVDRFNPVLPADLVIWFDNDTEPPLHSIQSLCQVLPLQSVRNFEVAIPLDLSPRDWVGILGRCTEIEGVSICGEEAISFLRALSLTTDCIPVANIGDCSQDQLFLGRLKSLHLLNVDFHTDWGGRDRYMTHQLVIQCLSARRRVKIAPILEIILQDCRIMDSWVANLEEVAIIARESEGGCKDEGESDGEDEEEDGEGM